MLRWGAEAPEWATVLSKDHCATPAKVYLLMIHKKSQLPLQPIRIGDVVGIHSGQARGTCPIDTFVHTGRDTESPSIAPADQTRVMEAVHDGQTLIARAVVAKQEFKVLVALVQERAYGKLQGSGAVEEGHCDGDPRRANSLLQFSSPYGV